MYCTKCGSNNPDDAKFCRNCSEPLAEMTEETVKPIFKPLSESDHAEPVPVQQPAAGFTPLTPLFPPKKKSHKALFIILGSVLLVLVIVGAAGVLFRNPIMKAVMPEQYLQMSLARTAVQSKNGAGQLLDLSKFATGAVKHEFTSDVDFEGSRASLDGSIMYDAETEKALVDVSIGAEGVSLDNNVLFISRDQIALSLPSQIKDTDFLTIDPATFNEDWTDKGYDDLAKIPDLQKLINIFFGKSEDGKAVKAADVKKDFLKYLTDEAEFSTGGTVTENIGGADRKLDIMTYTISKSDANNTYQEFVSDIEDKMAKAADMYASDSSQDVSGVFDELETLKVKSDIKISFYIDQDGYIKRIKIDPVKIEADDASEEIGLILDIWNEDGVAYTVAKLSTDSESGSAVLNIDSESSFKDGVYVYSCKLYNAEEGEDSDVTLEVEWDTKDRKGENLSVVFKSNENNKETLTGTLIEDESKISLSDATLELKTDTAPDSTLDFSYTLSKIDASEITLDTSDSTPLLEYKPFKDYMDLVLSGDFGDYIY